MTLSLSDTRRCSMAETIFQYGATRRSATSGRLLVLVSASYFHKSLTDLMESLISTEGTCAFYAVREMEDGAKYFPNNSVKPAAVPTGAIGSEGIVAQIITKLAAATHDALDHPPIKTLRRRQVHNVVLVDDVCVSGNRAAEFIRALCQTLPCGVGRRTGSSTFMLSRTPSHERRRQRSRTQ